MSPAPNVSVSAALTTLLRLLNEVLPETVCSVPERTTVPPLGEKVDVGLDVKFPWKTASPEGAVKWPPALRAKAPPTAKEPYDPKLYEPLTVRPAALRPENPDSWPPLARVRVPDVVSVPEPDRVPLKVIEPPPTALGDSPRGRVQLLPTILVPAVFEK